MIKIFFFCTLCLQILVLQLFPPISHLTPHSWPTVYLSLLTPSILSYSDFVKSPSKARKRLRGFRKLFRRSLPWPGLDENEDITVYQRQSIRNGGGWSEKPQHKASIPNMAAELENNRRENVRKLAKALDVSARMVYAALMRTAKLSKKSARWVKKRFSLEMKKERLRMHEAAEAMAAAILW